jgi:two-component system, OmpR family, sensor histidine kinase CreC
MLAHELRRRMAALRVVGEAIAMRRRQGHDTGALHDLLLDEIGQLDDLAAEVLGDQRPAHEADPGTAVDVAAAVRAAARTVAIARGAEVHVQAEAGVEVEASATMLRQAVENLIDNAAAHGGPEGVEVAIHADPAAGEVAVVVADRGAAQVASGGHGIGLSVVRRFVDDAGGRSWAAERAGGGTVVGLGLPLRPGTATGPDALDAAVNT